MEPIIATTVNVKLEDLDSTHQLHQSIASQEAMVAKVDQDLSALHSRIERRLAQKEELLTSLAHSRALIAPIRLLPVETLSMIFIACINDPLGARHETLALVCRWWRDVLRNTPLAWSRITLTFSDLTRSLRKAAMFMVRARKSRLTFKIRATQLGCVTAKGLNKILDIFDVYGDSWLSMRSISMEAGRDVPTSMLSEFFQILLDRCDAQHLETLRLTHWGAFTEEEAEVCGAELTFFKAIRTMDVPLSFIASPLSFHPGLTTLSISNGRTQTFFELALLEACPQLQELTLIDFSRNPPSKQSPLTLPHLTSLHLSHSVVRDIFFYLRTPSLQTLILENIAFLSTHALTSALNQFIVVPADGPPALTTFKLISSKFNQAGLIWVLSQLPTLIELEISGTAKLNSTFVSALSKEATPRRPWMLPNLKHLLLSSCRNLRAGILVEMVRARRRGIAEVKPVKGKRSKIEPPCLQESVILDGRDIIELEAGSS